MVWLGGPRRRSQEWIRGRGIFLHDAPPGYRPPRRRVPLQERERELRQERTLLRVASVVLALAAAAFVVIILVFIAIHA
jgi:hypothetical protein